MTVDAKLEITEGIDHSRAAKYRLSIGGTIVFDQYEHHLSPDQKALARVMIAGIGVHATAAARALT